MKKTILVTLIVTTISCLMANVQAQTCTPTKASLCNDGECKSTPTSNSWTIINKDQLLRCDSKGCDKYSISATKSGQFTTVQIPNTSYILKFDEQLNFVEVVSFSLSVIVYAGQCRN